AQETHNALHILQQARERGAEWLHKTQIATNKHGQQVLMIDAPTSYSAEINALLARNSLFAAEIHPHEGSLEDFFLEVTTASAPLNQRIGGMEALVRSNEPIANEISENAPETSSRGRGGVQ